MKFGKTWLVKDMRRWKDFSGYLYGRGYRNFCGNTSILVDLNSLKEDGKVGVIGNSFSVISIPEDNSLVLSFTGPKELGIKLIEGYLAKLPEECRSEIF